MLEFRFSRRIEVEAITPCDFAAQKAHPALDLVVRREYYDAGKTTGGHRHLDFCALYVVRAGRGVHQIDGVPFGIARGDVYLLPPGATHAYLDFKQLEIDAFYFPLSFWSDDELAALREISGFWRLFMESDAQRLHLRPEAHRDTEVSIAEMRREFRKDERATPFLLRGLLFRFLVGLVRAAAPLGDCETLPTAPSLTELLSWCETNVGGDISVAQLAGRMFFSPAHFARLFKREMGLPPATYLRRLKLEHARAQLQNSGRSVAQIALDSGFESAAHFSRAFRACYGASPLEFRRGVRK